MGGKRAFGGYLWQGFQREKFSGVLFRRSPLFKSGCRSFGCAMPSLCGGADFRFDLFFFSEDRYKRLGRGGQEVWFVVWIGAGWVATTISGKIFSDGIVTCALGVSMQGCEGPATYRKDDHFPLLQI
jgi:hypothetical protein